MSTTILSHDLITIEGKRIEQVEEYNYLGQVIRLGRDPKDVFHSEIPQSLKTRVYNQCVLSVIIYACETWTLTGRSIHKLKVTQRAMELSMLGISFGMEHI